MKSPFPGMDPYLEKHWGDVHSSCIIYTRDQLQEFLPSALRARVQERVVVETEGNGAHSMYPDVRIVAHGKRRTTLGRRKGGVAIAEPLLIQVDDEPETQTFIEIIDVGSGKRVVTVIEFLSVSNKTPGPGMELYRKKQRELNRGRVNLVEIDLLREGQHVLAVPKERIPVAQRTPYRVCVRRGWRSSALEVYPITLAQRLPTISIPLRMTDKDVPLDLQAILHQCYQRGRYDDIDYSADPEPSLSGKEAAWANRLLRSKRLR